MTGLDSHSASYLNHNWPCSGLYMLSPATPVGRERKFEIRRPASKGRKELLCDLQRGNQSLAETGEC
ncbi:hypothetical protein SADUNF_Sadunf09G0080800 [Salix dunnii]|uniref:Uncharacterized protein n=1 Tax=Salix dunnii TaxID=1413687 RepID=A0A835JVP6_9ROSI|nr:hypothetical protein SADUNF_Sadunf09G0080800 [Salix dunnii]